jgi:hypothetical protein
MQRAAAAGDPHASGDERNHLLRMRKALLELAAARRADWLDGKSSEQQPVLKIPA